ncbi:MAG: hypothetical protein HOC71_05930 [Candidatus Latescibacteria bacterium]|jgi:hypothetical protein|nr:hypothetical protein [Candidatus Latescibacterota bacterium]
MHLRDYLNDIPLKAVKVIADTLGIKVEYRARIKLVNAIDRVFWDGSLTERLIDSLSEDHRHILTLIAFSYNAGIHESVLAQKMEKLSGINRQQVIKLVHDLFPFALVGCIKEGDMLYFSPGDIGEQVRKVLIDNNVTIPASFVKKAFFAPPHLLEDIFSFLAMAYKEPVPLTLKGLIKKSFLERIFEGSQTCNDHSLRFTEEIRNTFVMEYLKTRSFISFNLKDVRVTPELSGWLKLTMTERIQDILSYTLSNKFQESSAFISLNGILAELPVNTSFNVRGFTRFLNMRTVVSDDGKRLESRVSYILSILSKLGLLSFAAGRFTVTETGKNIFRGQTLPVDDNMDTSFTIQPNFEVFAGPELQPRIRFLLELLATRKSRDTVLTFVVTQEGIARARERGMSTEEVIRFFEEHSKNPVPQNVRFSVEAWANNYGNISFENVTIMRFRDAVTCSSVKHSPDIIPYIREQLSDTVLIISSGHIPMIYNKLKQSNYLPEMFGETEPDPLLSGRAFTPTCISDLVEKYNIQGFCRKLIFPPHFLAENDSE